jgi:hypothetical protein
MLKCMIPTHFGLDVVGSGPTVGTFTCALMHPEFEYGKLFLDTSTMSMFTFFSSLLHTCLTHTYKKSEVSRCKLEG